MNQDIQHIAREINKCNQRGGRMLSLVDLIEAGTLTLDVAAYLAARVAEQKSFLVGAMPGGAGKTTLMGALLACVPPGCELIPTENTILLNEAPEYDANHPRCYVCHEIGSGIYYAYLWDQGVRAFCRLHSLGHARAGNLHADTYEQCREQLCDDNRVPESDFNALHLLIFLGVSYGWKGVHRQVDTIWESDGMQPHQLVYSMQDRKTRLCQTDEKFQRVKQILETLLRQKNRTIEDFRESWLQLI